MASVASSTTPAALSSTGNLVNLAAGYPAAEKYPGAVNPQQYLDPGPERPIEGPVHGSWGSQLFSAPGPAPVSGGGIVDASYIEGHDAPMVPWDSSAGEPFAPSGALNPDLHAQDLGAVFVHQHTTPAFIGELRRFTPTGQTYNEQSETQEAKVSYDPNGRQDYDQYQTWDPAPGDGGGYAPWDPGYAERPVLLNVAHQADPVTPVDDLYGVNGLLPDRSQWNSYPAVSYEAPADPAVSQAPAAAQAPVSGGWLLG